MYELLHCYSNRTCVDLYSLGGIGKTQLAIEYIGRHEEKYMAIFWLNANDQDSLKLSFRDIAQQVLEDHPSTSLFASVDLDDLNQIVDKVKACLICRTTYTGLLSLTILTILRYPAISTAQ